MNATAARNGLSKVKLAIAALAAACLMLALGSSAAKAAPAAGDPFTVEFNYVGLTTGAAGNDIDELVLKDGDEDGEGQPLPPLKMVGQYTDDQGNFKLPQATGLQFPPISLDVGPVTVDGAIALLEDGSGNYNSDTGALSMNTKISLTLGVDDVQALADEIGFPIPGTGALKCKIGPLDVNLSTAGQWPHDGSAFADPVALTDGSVSGYWDHKPEAESVNDDGTPDASKQYLCDLIGGLLDPVGGLWLGNSTTPITVMPPASGDKPNPPICEAPLEGNYPDCKEPDTPEPDDKKAKITAVKLLPKKKAIKAGKKVKLKVKVTNKGDAAGKVTVKLNLKKKKGVKLAKKVTLNVGAGKTATKAVVFKTTKKAKGKYKVVAVGQGLAKGKKANSTITVKKAKKKKKKRK